MNHRPKGKIKDNNTYSHIQGFGGHNYQIIKVIELKNNQLLSYSIDHQPFHFMNVVINIVSNECRHLLSI